MFKKLLPYLALVLIAFSSSAMAQDQTISIQDTAGITRATSAVEDAGDVTFSLSDASGGAADNIEVTLTNVATGETFTAVAANGTVVFESLPPGVWTVATTAEGITFTGVSIIPASAAVAAGAVSLTTVGLGVAAAGGATAIAVSASDGSSDDDNPPLSPSN